MKFQKHKLIQVGDNKLIVSDEIIHRIKEEKPLDGIPVAEEIGVEELALKHFNKEAEMLYPYAEITKFNEGYISTKHRRKKDSERMKYVSIAMSGLRFNIESTNKSDGVFTESDMNDIVIYYMRLNNETKFELSKKPKKELLSLYLQSLPQSISLLCNDDGEPIMIDNTFKYRK